MIEPTIIFEDQDILVLNKPAGLAMHRDDYTPDSTLADWLIEKYPVLSGVGETFQTPKGLIISKPGIVHRLDKDTSGVVVVAKTPTAFVGLKNQFKNHTIAKTYRLIVYGEVKLPRGQAEGVIRLPIGRSRQDPRIRLAGRQADGVLREALTYYRVLETYPNYSYIEARPKTGRTHQLRAHFKAINHPIACDKLYAPTREFIPGLERQALHALRLEFVHPNGRPVSFEAPLPADFLAALEKIKTL